MKTGINMTYKNSTPSQPSISDAKTVGVKEQNLFLDNATLTINNNLTVEDTLECRNFTLDQNLESSCDLYIRGDLGNVITDLKETVLDGDLVISCSADSSNNIPKFKNIGDPKSARDAITFNYFSLISPQAYHCYSEFQAHTSGGGFAGGDKMHFKGNWKGQQITVTENSTPLLNDAMEVQDDRILLKKPGIYQVAYQVLRRGGDHQVGGDDATLFLNLNFGNSELTLCTGDTRGHDGNDETTTSLYAIFSLPSQTGSSASTPYIYVSTRLSLFAGKSSMNVIWFPYGQSYEEVD